MKKPPPPPLVTDHAVLRYLERVYGVDIDALRARIERITAEARAQGARGLNSDGVAYQLSQGGRVITVTGTKGRKASTRAARWKRRRP